MAPKFVAPYRMTGRRGKNDAADAAAICEAVTLLKAEGIIMPWLPEARGALLVLATLWSMALALGMLGGTTASRPRKLFATLSMATGVSGVIAPWLFLFYLW